jgi:biotin carboxyl carrier protein
MNIKEVKELISDILQSDICEFELEHTCTKVRLKRGSLSQERLPISSPTQAATLTSPAAVSLPPESPTAAENAGEEDLHLITSPIVGTIHNAGTPKRSWGTCC